MGTPVYMRANTRFSCTPFCSDLKFNVTTLWDPQSTFLMGLKIDFRAANPLNRNMMETSASTVGHDTQLWSPP